MRTRPVPATLLAALALATLAVPPAAAQEADPAPADPAPAGTVPADPAPAETVAAPDPDPADVVPLAADPDDVAPHPGPGELRAAAGSVAIAGRGWGHGRGLGQYGSLGYAVDHGWSHRRIVDHFYGGTTAGTVAPRDMLIHLTGYDGRDLIVSSGRPFTVGPHPFAAGEEVRVELAGGGDFRVFRNGAEVGVVAGVSNGGRGPGTHLEVVPERADPGDDPRAMLALRQPDRTTRAYRGRLWLLDLGGRGYTANLVGLEDYVRGVVPRESPASWGALGGGTGIEALKAQAVAARSYAVRLAANRARFYVSDACDTTACQVYGGAAVAASGGGWIGLDHGGHHAASTRAVAATRGEVRLDPDGRVSLTEFSSSTGGYTAERSWRTPDGVVHPNNPYGPVPDAGDDVSANPNDQWGTVVDGSAVIARGEASCRCELGTFAGVEVTSRNGLGAQGGRVRELRIKGTGGSATLRIPNWAGDSFRRAFGLKSDWYAFPDFDTEIADGFWVARADGAVAAFGSADHHGDLLDFDLRLNAGVVDIVAHPTGAGYWTLGGDGGVFSFGASSFFGSTGNIRLNAPVVGMAAHPSGEGYWFVASDGGVFSYGAAGFHGSMGGVPLVSPVVGMASTPSGRGYWLVAADGGVFAFGDAPFYGSIGGAVLGQPVVDMAVHPSGRGYWFVTRDGGVFNYADSGFYGSATGRASGSVVGMAPAPEGDGYWVLQANSLSHSFNVDDFPSSAFGRDGAARAVAIATRPA